MVVGRRLFEKLMALLKSDIQVYNTVNDVDYYEVITGKPKAVGSMLTESELK